MLKVTSLRSLSRWRVTSNRTTVEVRVVSQTGQCKNTMRGVRKFKDRLWFVDKTYKLKYIPLNSQLVETMKPEILELPFDHKVTHFEFYNNFVYAMAEDGNITKCHIEFPTLRFKGFHQKDNEWFTTLLPISSKLCLLASAYRKTGTTTVNCKLSVVGGKLKYRDRIEVDALVDSIRGGRFVSKQVAGHSILSTN